MKDSTLNNKIINYFKGKGYLTIFFMCFFILWKGLSVFIGKEIILPSPETTLFKILELMGEKDFLIIVFSTIKRTIISFGLAFLFAIFLGFLSSKYKTIQLIMGSMVSIIRSLPTMAIIILSLIWLGGEKSPILIGFIVVFPILYSNIIEGIKEVDNKLMEMAKIYNVNRKDIILNIYLPSIKNYLFAGINAALGLAFKVMISAEVMAQPKYAMGTRLYIEKINLEMSGVFAWAIILVLISFVFDGILKKIFRSYKVQT
ncbi:ABC transporter permease [Clostridium grantii]|uniref:NitT/TauT family transport system permease protein n=1 Tax=Clostridium grantii DSM 8605 TaxID=1121316 RepID=A0A1M5UDH4_9CLOT|nr:ABC transporter permease subunit [Clostridium grantii]SHH60866.1 NitT/TauT family transport system permease protein [Clostridium grantii DSM 8605]